MHVLLLCLPGNRPRRSHGLCRACSARAARPTALDPRNDATKVARSLALTGIFNCVSCYKCEEVCPASIPIVSQVIEPLKARAAALAPAMATHPLALRAVVAQRGRVD